jgi:predicted nucleotide-binding protein (sugar kinase/HSP70/actin superfamily)
VRSLESFGEIKFEKIAFPLLFLPFVSRASEVIGKKLQLSVDNRIFLLNYNNSIYSNSLNEGIIENGKNILIKFKENEDSFEEKEWKELYELSENIFVEENDSLKNVGAGAGLTDND